MDQPNSRRVAVQQARHDGSVLHSGIVWLVLFFFLTPLWAQEGTAPRPLTLEDAVALALQHHPALREADSRTAAARAGVDRADAAHQVQVKVDSRYATVGDVPTLTAAGGMPVVLGHDTTWLTTLAAQKVIYSGGRLEALIRQATSTARATDALQDRTRQQVAFGAERAFLLLVAAQREREVAQQALQTAEEHLAIARARYAARAAAQFDVLRAEVQVEEARQDVIRAESNLQVTHAALVQALGMPEGAFTVAEADLAPVPDLPALEDLQRQAGEARPEIRAFDWRVRAAESAISAARAERRPTLSLLADYQLVSPESPLQLTRWSAGIAVSLPILDGGAARARQREAMAQRDETQAAQDALRQAILAEVSQAYARVRSAHAQIVVARKRVEQSEETLRIANVRYQEGVGTATEIADAQTTLTRARQGLTRARAEAGITEAELRLATGATNTSINSRLQEMLP